MSLISEGVSAVAKWAAHGVVFTTATLATRKVWDMYFPEEKKEKPPTTETASATEASEEVEL